ncbi:MAG: SAM-dependent methyltransferase [Opitutales bacterium]
MNDNEKIIRARIREASSDGAISFRDYIEYALYTPGAGYYTRPEARVGRTQSRDFYTAESLGSVFSRLVVAAARQLLGPDTCARSTFVEIGAEPGYSLLDAIEEPPFAAHKILRHGDALTIPPQSVVFANEWLDALPFHRLIFRAGTWRERGVRANPEGRLEEALLDEWSPRVAAVRKRLPEEAPEGYQLDLPLDAERALADLVSQDWNGLLLLFDYGRTHDALTSACPSGTARTYQRHKQGQDLLEAPGDMDITCDVCWDPLQAELSRAGFKSVALESQEAFFAHHAEEAAAAIVRDTAGAFSRERQTLMELMHPAHMGQRFQVLRGVRTFCAARKM